MSGHWWFVLGLFTGVSLLGVFNFFNTKFTKDKLPKEGYNEHNLPKGCTLIQLGDKYMFKIKNKYANMDDYGHFLWSFPDYVSRFGVTKDKQFAIKRGIETFEFFKALGKI